jgi:aminopeptidase N
MLASFAVVVVAHLAVGLPASATSSHDIVVTLDPAAGTVSIRDRLQLRAKSTVHVELHAGFSPAVSGAVIRERRVVDDVEHLTIDVAAAKKPVVDVVLTAAGSIGSVNTSGVLLSPEQRWYPVVVDDSGPALLTARVKITGLPAGWRGLSEGSLNDKTNTWEQTTPVEGLHVVAGPFSEAQRAVAGVDVRIWLRTVDGTPASDADALATTYLGAAQQYLALYSELIGAYPYAKFVLVENGEQTGSGMPSFTLLGSQVVRLPFIVHTSWPHELLHNWWGNGVFPPVSGGNWTEGLTTYLADHLSDERQGRGAEHRRSTIQRYLDVVATNPEHDFPLVDFTSRSSSASSAIGYGKTLMVFHMLRKHLGDDVFKQGLQTLWRTQRFRRASYVDVAAAFSAAAGTDVLPFVTAWFTTAGIPSIVLDAIADAANAAGEHTATITLSRTGPGLPLRVPVVVTTVDGRSVSGVVEFVSDATRARATLPVPAPVARVDVDPFFDVFRTLLPEEGPPSLSRSLGARDMVFVTPTQASTAEIDAWKAFAQTLCPNRDHCTIVDDVTIQSLPATAAVWVLGYGNLLRAGPFVFSKPYDVRFDDRGFFGAGGWARVMAAADRKAAYDVERIAPERSALAVVVEHPKNRALTMTFVGTPLATMVPLLTRKLPHYGAYGAVAFTGEAGANTFKAQWPASSSVSLSRVLVEGVPFSTSAPPALVTPSP